MRQVHKIDVGNMSRKEADKVLQDVRDSYDRRMKDTEIVCCWCRKVIKKGEEHKHIHTVILRKM